LITLQHGHASSCVPAVVVAATLARGSSPKCEGHGLRSPPMARCPGWTRPRPGGWCRGRAWAWLGVLCGHATCAGAADGKEERLEAKMIKSLANCPLCKDKEPCLLDCRFGQKRGWRECLEECLNDNPMVKDIMIKMADRNSEEAAGEQGGATPAPSPAGRAEPGGGSLRATPLAPREPLARSLGGLSPGGAGLPAESQPHGLEM